MQNLKQMKNKGKVRIIFRKKESTKKFEKKKQRMRKESKRNE